MRAAGSVRMVPAGTVDALSAELLDAGVDAELVVALGGGRVIDVAKAVVAGRGRGRVAAVPTTLSAAEMTSGHRLPRGLPASTPHVRPAIVLNDPALSASQPAAALAASTGNALAHAAEAPLTPRRTPVSTLAARRAATLLAGGWADPDVPDREALALGALLSGYAIDAAGYGLAHVLSQTVVRQLGGRGHGPVNAVVLPHALGALARRFPVEHEELTLAVGGDPVEVAGSIAALAGATRLRDVGLAETDLEAVTGAAAARPDLDQTPPAAGRDEIAALYRAAW